MEASGFHCDSKGETIEDRKSTEWPAQANLIATSSSYILKLWRYGKKKDNNNNNRKEKKRRKKKQTNKSYNSSDHALKVSERG